MEVKKIKIGTRGSKLALWQANHLRELLNTHFPELQVELKIIKTTGDRIQERSLIGLGKGLFTKEIQMALLSGEIDLAVHSMKDLPTEIIDENLTISTILRREDPRDALISCENLTVEQLPQNAKIGTSSPRRQSQLLYIRPDLQMVELRGNIDTRLRKLHETDLNAIVLATAGVKRLIGEEIITQHLSIDEMVPAAGQGAIGIEIRKNDDNLCGLLQKINDAKSELEVTVEREVLSKLGGGCQMPIGVNARLEGDLISVIGAVLTPDGSDRVVRKIRGDAKSAMELANSLATALLMRRPL